MAVDNPFPEQPRGRAWFQTLGLAAIELLPVVGPPATSLITEGMRQSAREKDAEWGAMVSARLDSIERAGVPVDVTEPEFIAAVRHLQNAAAQTADGEKLQLLARAAANAGPWSHTELSVREEYLSLVADLPAAHIKALALVDAAQEIPGPGDGGTPPMPFDQFAKDLGGDRSLAQRLMIGLQQRGLFGTPLNGVGDINIEITRFGAGLIRFLQEHNQPQIG
ncbi:hypothetical protein [Microbacterium sp. P04]|uniref:hypothetical protein n=1 Tax=Microbacterium sp. P04 TaxID=3366947 RepID=UPI003746EB20